MGKGGRGTSGGYVGLGQLQQKADTFENADCSVNAFSGVHLKNATEMGQVADCYAIIS